MKLAILGLLLVAVAAGVFVRNLQLRTQRIQALYNSVAIGDPWQGLDGFTERRVISEPGSAPPRQRRYHYRVAFFLPSCWEVVVDADGRVAGKHRYE